MDEAIRIPREVVNELFAWNEHVVGRIIRVTEKLLAHPKVMRIDLSDELLDVPAQASI